MKNYKNLLSIFKKGYITMLLATLFVASTTFMCSEVKASSYTANDEIVDSEYSSQENLYNTLKSNTGIIPTQNINGNAYSTISLSNETLSNKEYLYKQVAENIFQRLALYKWIDDGTLPTDEYTWFLNDDEYTIKDGDKYQSVNEKK